MGVYDYSRNYGHQVPEDATMDASERCMKSTEVKTYVEVWADFSPEGKIMPMVIIWEDGRNYVIDRILRIDRAASRKAGGAGIRYACKVLGKEINLFYEGGGRWFVERKVPAQTTV